MLLVGSRHQADTLIEVNNEKRGGDFIKDNSKDKQNQYTKLFKQNSINQHQNSQLMK